MKLGVTIEDVENVGAGRPIDIGNPTSKKKGVVYPIGWFWEFVLKANDGVTLSFKFVACTYIGFSRGMATDLFGQQDNQPWFVDTGLNTFLSPKTCDLVLNVCDEAHVLRATTVRELKDSKAASSEGITETAVTELKNMGINDPMSYHAWAWPPKNTRWTKKKLRKKISSTTRRVITWCAPWPGRTETRETGRVTCWTRARGRTTIR